MTSRLLCCSGSLDGGGSERQLWQLAVNVDRQRYEPSCYLHYRRGVYLERLPADLKVHAFWADERPKRWYLPGEIFRRQISHLREVIRREKIDLVYDRTYHMTLVTADACRALGIPRISVITRTPSDDWRNAQERFRRWKRSLLRRAYAEPGAITVAVSRAVADDAAAFYRLPRESIEVLPTPVDIETIERLAQQFLPSIESGALDPQTLDPQTLDPQTLDPQTLDPGTHQRSASETRPASTPFRIAVVGRLSQEKGQMQAIQAAQRFAQRSGHAVEVELLGDGPDRDRLSQLAESLPTSVRVRLLGYVENPYPWMRAADIVCVPSRYEGLPNVVLEAMTLRTPVISTRCNDSLIELLGSQGERGVLVAVDDVDALAEQFQRRVESPELWQQRGEAAYRWVRQHHGLGQWIEHMYDLFARSLAMRVDGQHNGPRQVVARGRDRVG